MIERLIHMLIGDPEMIDALSMTRIIFKAVVSKEDRAWIAGSKTSDGIAAPESANGRASVRMKARLTFTQ